MKHGYWYHRRHLARYCLHSTCRCCRWFHPGWSPWFYDHPHATDSSRCYWSSMVRVYLMHCNSMESGTHPVRCPRRDKYRCHRLGDPIPCHSSPHLHMTCGRGCGRERCWSPVSTASSFAWWCLRKSQTQYPRWRWRKSCSTSSLPRSSFLGLRSASARHGSICSSNPISLASDSWRAEGRDLSHIGRFFPKWAGCWREVLVSNLNYPRMCCWCSWFPRQGKPRWTSGQTVPKMHGTYRSWATRDFSWRVRHWKSSPSPQQGMFPISHRYRKLKNRRNEGKILQGTCACSCMPSDRRDSSSLVLPGCCCTSAMPHRCHIRLGVMMAIPHLHSGFGW